MHDLDPTLWCREPHSALIKAVTGPIAPKLSEPFTDSRSAVRASK